MRIGLVLRLWRQANGLSQEKVAFQMGVSQPALSRLERGGNPDGETLAVVIRWLLSKAVEV